MYQALTRLKTMNLDDKYLDLWQWIMKEKDLIFIAK